MTENDPLAEREATLNSLKGLGDIAPYLRVGRSDLGGPTSPTGFLTVSLDEPSAWPCGILENSRQAKFVLHWPERSIKLLTAGAQMGQFRKSRFKTPEDAVKKIRAYLEAQAGL